MAGALRGDPEAVRAGEVDRGDDVVDGLRLDDGGGTLVDGQVPGLPVGVPRRVAGDGHLAVEERAQRLDVEAESGAGSWCGQGLHVVSPLDRLGEDMLGP